MRRLVVPALFLFLFVVPSTGRAASLSSSPSEGSYSVGEQIPLKIIVSSENASVNAISGVLSFPPDSFAVQSVLKTGSIIDFWVTEPKAFANTGTVRFEGVSLSGFQGSAGAVVTVVLRPLKIGTASVSFQSGQVLANDGQGTDVTSGLSGSTFSIQPAKTRPTPVPTVEPKLEPLTIPTLKAPVITLSRVAATPVIVGTSVYRNTDVVLTFVSSAGANLFMTSTTDVQGAFELAVPQALRSGPYAVTAVIALRDGTRSSPSNVLAVEIADVFFVGMTKEHTIYVLLFLTILLLALIGYLMSRAHFNTNGRALATKKGIQRAEGAVKKSFDLLEQDLDEHMKSQNVSEKKEREEIAALKKDLRDAESYIDKEIERIPSIRANEKE